MILRQFLHTDPVAFRIRDEAEFVRAMTTDTPPAPPRAAEFRALNAA